MKKTITINISNLVFNIEEDAYASLEKYLKRIGEKFNNLEERQEIIEDIEARIAELFSENLNRSKEIITSLEVNNIVDVMGSPDNFEEEDSNGYSEKQNEPNSTQKNEKKKLFRDSDNRVVGGVCAGASYYFDWDASIIRIMFACSVFLFGTGFWIYIILWIIIPKTKSTSDKLAMEGKNITADSISSFVTKVKSSFNNIGSGQIDEKARTNSTKFNDFLIGTSQTINNTLQIKENGMKLIRFFSTLIGLIIISVGLIILTNIITCLFIPNCTIEDAMILNFGNSILQSKLTTMELFNISLIVFNIAIGLSLIINGIRLIFLKKKELIQNINSIGSLTRFITILSFMGLVSSYAVKKGSHSSFSHRTSHTLDYKKIVIKNLKQKTQVQSIKKLNLTL